MHEHARLGRSGEDAACRLYERMGFSIVDRNFRAGRGEIDLVAQRGSLLVFCEVKTRTDPRHGLPAEAVGYRKKAQIKRLAGAYLAGRHPGATEIRFDVVSVVAGNGTWTVQHIPGAF